MLFGKSGSAILSCDDEVSFETEVIDAMLPGKSSKLEITRDRTPNRHRWTGLEAQGA